MITCQGLMTHERSHALNVNYDNHVPQSYTIRLYLEHTRATNCKELANTTNILSYS